MFKSLKKNWTHIKWIKGSELLSKTVQVIIFTICFTLISEALDLGIVALLQQVVKLVTSVFKGGA